jgi:putative intracellular protease/amidase
MEGGVSKRYRDKAFMNLLDNTLRISDVDPTAYDAIYMTGGHGVMFDFPKSAALADLISKFYESNKIVSAVCHGPSGLLEAKLSNGDYLIKDKNITGFSWSEEVMAKRDQAVPFSLEEELQKRGAKYSKALLPFNSHIVEDGLVITGQNPGSARAVGKAVVAKLKQI